jgi:hypothetical protein
LHPTPNPNNPQLPEQDADQFRKWIKEILEIGVTDYDAQHMGDYTHRDFLRVLDCGIAVVFTPMSSNAMQPHRRQRRSGDAY